MHCIHIQQSDRLYRLLSGEDGGQFLATDYYMTKSVTLLTCTMVLVVSDSLYRLVSGEVGRQFLATERTQ